MQAGSHIFFCAAPLYLMTCCSEQRAPAYAIVEGMNVRGSRVGNYLPRWNAASSQELLVIRPNGVANLHFAILDRVGRKYPSFIPADPGLDPAASLAQLGSLGRDDSPEGFPVKRYDVRAAGWADFSQRLRRYRR